MKRILVIGSGAGGAVTAHELARHGLDVLVAEEGNRFDLAQYGQSSPEAMRTLYRARGMTPIVGPVPIGYVEGRCLGGSTEINSGFWHRTPRETLLRWRARYDLEDASPESLEQHFHWAEEQLGVSLSGKDFPPSTEALRRGSELMGWSAQEVPRAARGCKSTNVCAQGCPKGAKQGMTRSLIPAAEKMGAKILTGCRVKQILKRGRRVTGALVELSREGRVELMRIDADHIFLCCGPTETPTLLQRSGFRLHIGDSFLIHPMLKVAARFPHEMDAANTHLPLVQVKEFWPELSIGGAFFSPGHLAMLMADNWPQTKTEMRNWRRMATYYVGVRGNGQGTVRPSFLDDTASLRYTLSDEDVCNLSRGLARLAMLLLAAGAEVVFPGVHGLAPIQSEVDAVRWLDDRLSRSSLSLTTVHAFSSCVMGERQNRCALDSYGRLHGFENLYVNDASMLPDSPGVNPQGSIMAFARRNVHHFVETLQ